MYSNGNGINVKRFGKALYKNPTFNHFNFNFNWRCAPDLFIIIIIIINITILESTIGGNIIFILIVIHSLDVRAKKFFLPNVFPSYVNYLGLFRFVS